MSASHESHTLSCHTAFVHHACEAHKARIEIGEKIKEGSLHQYVSCWAMKIRTAVSTNSGSNITTACTENDIFSGEAMAVRRVTGYTSHEQGPPPSRSNEKTAGYLKNASDGNMMENMCSKKKRLAPSFQRAQLQKQQGIRTHSNSPSK